MRAARPLLALLLVLPACVASWAALARPAPEPAQAARPQASPVAPVESAPPPAPVAPTPPVAAPATSAAPVLSASPIVAEPAAGPALLVVTVRGPDGRAVAGAQVHRVGELHGHGGAPRTDAAGLLTLTVPTGPGVLLVWSPLRDAAAVVSYVVEAGEQRIVEPTLARLVPVTVWLEAPDGRRRRAGWVQGDSLAAPELGPLHGDERRPLLAWPGRTRVTVRHADGSPHVTAELDVGSEPAELILPVAASVRLAGVVVGPDGAPVPNADVVVVRAPRAGGRWAARTDGAGRFALDDLPADRLVVEARAYTPQRRGQAELELAEGASGELRLTLAPMATLRGRLVLPPQVERIVPIDLRLRGAGERVRPLHTESHDGSFECGWLPDGAYTVSVPDDWLPELAAALGVPRVVVRPVEVTVAGGRDVEVLLRVD